MPLAIASPRTSYTSYQDKCVQYAPCVSANQVQMSDKDIWALGNKLHCVLVIQEVGIEFILAKIHRAHAQNFSRQIVPPDGIELTITCESAELRLREEKSYVRESSERIDELQEKASRSRESRVLHNTPPS